MTGEPALTARTLALIAAGGAIGALGRYGLTRAFPVAPGTFPTTTLAINVAGAGALAFLLETLARRGAPDHWVRLAIGVGLLGAFTTFSTLAAEVALLWRDGHAALAVGYSVASIVGGAIAVGAGLAAAGYRAPPLPSEGEA